MVEKAVPEFLNDIEILKKSNLELKSICAG
jgi:hypothetical protein